MSSASRVAVLLTAILAGPASAHIGDRVFPIYELPTSDLPDLHDGTLEDWEQVLPDASLDHIDLNEAADATQALDPSDLAIRVFLAWHSGSQRVFVGVEWVDDVLVPPSEALWRDHVYFMLDGDHSGGRYEAFPSKQYSEAEQRLLEESQAQLYCVDVPPLPEGTIWHPGAAAPWVTAPPWSDACASQEGECPSHVVMEMYFTPWDQLHWEGPEQSRRTVLEAGKIVGFQLLVVDNDEPRSGAEIYMIGEYSPSGTTGDVLSNAELFADGELIPCSRGDCSGATTSAPWLN